MHPEYNFSLVFSTVCPMKLITKPKALGFSAVIVCSRLGYERTWAPRIGGHSSLYPLINAVAPSTYLHDRTSWHGQHY